MSVNHRINVYFYEKGEKSKVKGNGSKTSAATSLRTNINKANKKKIDEALTKSSQETGILFGGISKAAGMVYAGLQTLNQAHNVVLDYKASISGNTMTAGNIKKAKSIVLGFGVPYVYESLKNEFFTKNVIHRENISSQYYRDLYYDKYEGNQYSGRPR